jgi:porin
MLGLVVALVLSQAEAPAPETPEVAPPADAAPAKADPPEPTWWTGDHLTGEWAGARTWLADHGVTIDLLYAIEVITNVNAMASTDATSVAGHIDLGISLDFEKMGLWKGGHFYVLAQNGHGTGINEYVGSATAISNIEAPPYTQLTEFFFEQTFFDEKLRIRLGKQDANRDFGTPRFGGNFLNNNFGMFPSTPLPSYPTTGLGAAVIAQPVSWLALKAVLFEGSPRIDSWGFDSAFARNAGWMAVGGVAVTHRYGAGARSGGVSSAGVFGQAGQIAEQVPADLPMRTFNSNLGFFVQHDERLYAHPENPDDPSGLTLISRLCWSQPDRNQIPLYVGASVAWHGLGARSDDTVGVGFGWFTVPVQLGGTPGPGSELFVEVFYKWRLTHFLSLQPDLEYYRHPGGDGPDAVLVGARLKLKL